MDDTPLKLHDVKDKEDYLEIYKPNGALGYLYLTVVEEVKEAQVRLTRGQARLLAHWLLEAIDE